MPNGIGDKDHVLIQGRILYGHDGTNARAVRSSTTDVSGSALSILNVQVTPAKSIETELLAITAVAASSVVSSTVISMTGKRYATFFIDHARAGSAAFGTNGTEYRIEASQKATGNETWRTVQSWTASSAVAMTAAASADVAVGAATITILSGTAMVLNDIYFWPSGTAANSEWMYVAAISGTANFTVQDPLTFAHAAASGIVGGAQQWVLPLNVETYNRMRVIVNNNASGTTQAIYSRIACQTET